MKGVHLTILAAVALLTACQPNELEENVVAEPVFFLEGSIDGTPFDFGAGPDGRVVETDMHLGTDALPIFVTSFFNEQCDDCDHELSIEIVSPTSYDEGLDISDYLPLGVYGLADYHTDEELSQISVFVEGEAEFEEFGIFDEWGEEVHSSDDPPILDLPDGFYTFQFASVEFTGCIVGYLAYFELIEGNICAEFPTIEIDDDLFSYHLPDDSFGPWLVVVNGVPIFFEEGEEVDVDMLLNGEDYINEVSITHLDEWSCEQGVIWNFGNDIADGDCIPEVLYETESVQMSTPQTVRLRYQNSEGQIYLSEEMDLGGMDIVSHTASIEELEEGDAYTLTVSIDALLEPASGIGEPIQLTITDGEIPIVLQ